MKEMYFSIVQENSSPQQLSSSLTHNNRSLQPPETISNGKRLSGLATFLKSAKAKILTDAFISGVDEYAFKIFPVAFAMYNVFYWLDYL